MPVIEGASGAPYQSAGVPVAGTAEVQTLTIGGTPAAGDTFVLTSGPFRSDPIAWSATDATLVAAVDAALEALAGIGSGGVVAADVSLTSGVGDISLTFAAKADVPLLVASDFVDADGVASDGTAVVAVTTPGVAPAPLGVPKGGLVTDTTNAILYINTGTAAAPTFTKVGTQT